MGTRLRVGLALGVLASVLLLGGCLFNAFQTARMLQAGNMSMVIGSGLMDVGIDENAAWAATPQARLAFGLSDKVNLGLHTGVMMPLSTGDPGWMGFAADLKFGVINDPESISVALGVGGGSGIHFLGWGLFGGIYVDLNVLPVFFVYQPTIPMSGESFTVLHDVTLGVSLSLSDRARILLEVDTRNISQVMSFGLGFEAGF